MNASIMFSSSRFRGQSSNGTNNNNNASSTNSSSSSTTNSANPSTHQQQRMNNDESSNNRSSLSNITATIGKCEPFGEIGIDTNGIDQTVKNIPGLGLFY
jgi:hypothetical protein